MIHLIRYFFVLMTFGLAACSLEATGTESVHPIVEIHRNLVSSYDAKFSQGDFEGAYSSAKELLDIDPSNALSYLRLAVAARELNLNLVEIRNMYEASVAEATEGESTLKSLANALLTAPNS